MLGLYLALIFALIGSASAAAQTWTRLETENFELYTTAGDKRGREAILYFEQVRALFGKLFKGSDTASKLPVRIIAFRNEKEFLPFRPGQAAAAFYTPGPERDYIVMQSIASENYPVAVHEYVHRVAHSMGLELPIWLNEGMAELFATVKPVGNKVQMGQMDANRAMVVRSNPMIPFASFMAVGQDSPYYNERDKAGLFYAQAFALAHMLYYSEGYRGTFGKLQMAYQKSTDPAAVFLATYGTTLETVQRQLQKYMKQDRFYYGMVDVKLEKAAETPESRVADDYESKIVIADLYRITKNWAESARLYESAGKTAPQRPEAEEGLAWLSLYQNRHDEALPHLTRAIELGSKRPLILQNAALLSWSDSKRAMGYMQRALELDPDLKDGNQTLGNLAMNANQPRVALDALNRIKRVTPDKASALFRAKAHALLGLNDLDDARKNAELAKQYAKTETERSDATSLLAFLNQREQAGFAKTIAPEGNRQFAAPKAESLEDPTQPPPARPRLYRDPAKTVTGTLVDFSCDGKQPKLTVVDGAGRKSAYLILDPKNVLILNATDGYTHDFNCGPQKNTAVKIGFGDPPAGTAAGVTGIVRTIEFVK